MMSHEVGTAAPLDLRVWADGSVVLLTGGRNIEASLAGISDTHIAIRFRGGMGFVGKGWFYSKGAIRVYPVLDWRRSDDAFACSVPPDPLVEIPLTPADGRALAAPLCGD